MRANVTFHVRPLAGEERWTARAGQELLGRSVRYGRLGKVGEVVAAVPVNAGRSLRLHVSLSRRLVSPDRTKFRLAASS